MKIDLGKKHVCEICENKFYDLGEKNPICSKCGHVHKSVVDMAEEAGRIDSRIIDAIIQERADKVAKKEMRFMRGDCVEDLGELSNLDDEIIEEDHHNFDMESDGDAADYMDMNIDTSIVDEIEDGSDDYEERI